MYKEVKHCILCHGALTEVMDLGMQYVVDFVKEKDESLLKAPLVLMKCDKCNLIQLKHRVSQDRLYRKFWYRSGINEQMRDELLAVRQHAEATVELKPGDKVLDIGCNDGTLLGCYNKRVVTIGVDPCAELVDEGMKNNRIDIGIADYFSANAISKIASGLGIKSRIYFKIITAVAMFYDVPDPVQFLKECKEVLDREGVLVIQMNYLGAMLKDNAFDFICHEHQALYSVTTLKQAVEAAGLDLAGIEMSKSNGGSLRAYITHKGFDKFSINDHQNKLWLNTNVDMKLIEEMRSNMDKVTTYKAFAANIQDQMIRLKEYILSLTGMGKKVYVCGASTRGTVLLQYLYNIAGWGKDNCLSPLLGVADRDEHKHGLKMVGSWLDIMPEDLVRSKATHMLVLPWHFRESTIKREQEWIEHGGTLIFPLPKCQAVSKSQEVETFTHSQLV